MVDLSHDVSQALGLLFVVTLLSLSGCSGSEQGTPAPSNPVLPTPPQPAPIVLTVSGRAPAIGETVPFVATAVLSDSSTRNVSGDAEWRSSNTAVVTVSANGLVTGVATGEATVTATYSGLNASQALTLVVQVFTLSGRILDVETGAPIERAEVEVMTGRDAGVTSTNTDRSGTYTVSGLHPGQFSGRGRARGYESRDKSVSIAAENVRMDVELRQVCSFTISPLSFFVSSGGLFGGTKGVEQISVTASRPSCEWTASNDPIDWIVLVLEAGVFGHSVSGVGSSTVRVGATPSSNTRTSTLRFQWSGGGADVNFCQFRASEVPSVCVR
jgi:hypothetical protein